MKTTLLLGIAFIISSTAISQLSIDQTGTNYTINFDNSVTGINQGPFKGKGFTPTPIVGQLNSNGIMAIGLSEGDINFGDTKDTGDFARGSSTGEVGIGGIYSFETSTGNYALGIQPGGNDFTPGSFTIKLLNNTGNSIDAISISYDIHIYNDQDRANSFNFAYSTDNITYSHINELDLTSPAGRDPVPSWDNINKSTTISENIANGDYLYIRWFSDDNGGSGSRDEFAIDNITINASLANNKMSIKDELLIFPMPFNKQITIKGNNLASVALIDLTGKTILEKKIISKTKVILPTSQLANGIYLLRTVKSDGTIISKKVIKK